MSWLSDFFNNKGGQEWLILLVMAALICGSAYDFFYGV
jgi:hypothetical protein